MNKQKWRPEPSMRDRCQRCGHSREDHQGEKGMGKCRVCTEPYTPFAHRCYRFRRYVPRLAAPTVEPRDE